MLIFGSGVVVQVDSRQVRLELFQIGHEIHFEGVGMADVEKGQRRTVISWVFAGLLLAPVAWWLSKPLLGAVDLATQLLPDTLVAVEGQWLAQLLAPVNSVAGIAGLSFLVAWALYRKISS
jgi:hypothetical protein